MKFSGFRRKTERVIRTPSARNGEDIPWGKYILFGILFVLIIMGIWTLGNRLVYVRGRGILHAETTDIETKLTARIIEIASNVGDMVHKDQPVVFLDSLDLDYRIADMKRQLEERTSHFKERVTEVNNELERLETEIKNKRAEIDDLRKEHNRAKILLDQKAITHSQIMETSKVLKMAKRDLNTLLTESDSAKKQLASIKEEYNVFSNKVNKELEQLLALLDDTVLTAPTDGIVTEIFKPEGETVRPGDAILRISNPSKSFINAYFNESEEDEIKPGLSVRIVFENGDTCDGQVTKVYPAAFPLPPEYQNRYGSREIGILAEVAPTDSEKEELSRILETKAKVYFRRSLF
ncbi:MAG: HlyD family secretion protein [Thermodesulfobacteriota bacterium]